MQISKQINSAMVFTIAMLLSFVAASIGACASSDLLPPEYDVVDSVGTKGVTLDKDGPDAWQHSPDPCGYTGTVVEKYLPGSEWACAQDYFYTCIMRRPVSLRTGGDVCEVIQCGPNWIDEERNLSWISPNKFTHLVNGQPSQCTRVSPVQDTVKTVEFEWWKNAFAGSFIIPYASPIKVEITFGDQPSETASPYKLCCNVGESHITLHFEGDGPGGAYSTVLCIPDPSTGYDLHIPNCAHAETTVETAYVKQSDTGFADCPGGGHIKIVTKGDDGTVAGYSNVVLCKDK